MNIMNLKTENKQGKHLTQEVDHKQQLICRMKAG
jgi:hypothetical protein